MGRMDLILIPIPNRRRNHHPKKQKERITITEEKETEGIRRRERKVMTSSPLMMNHQRSNRKRNRLQKRRKSMISSPLMMNRNNRRKVEGNGIEERIKEVEVVTMQRHRMAERGKMQKMEVHLDRHRPPTIKRKNQRLR